MKNVALLILVCYSWLFGSNDVIYADCKPQCLAWVQSQVSNLGGGYGNAHGLWNNVSARNNGWRKVAKGVSEKQGNCVDQGTNLKLNIRVKVKEKENYEWNDVCVDLYYPENELGGFLVLDVV